MTNPDPDAELIERMAIAACGLGIPSWQALPQHQRDILTSDMRRALAVVREHEAPKPSPAPKRVAVQIAIDSENSLFALASDGTIHGGWYEDGDFTWRGQLPPLPQPDDAP